jgi:hypothetical protein
VIESVGRLVASGKTVALLVDNPPLPPLRNCNGRLTALSALNAVLDLRQGATDPDCQYAIGKYRADAKVYLDMMVAVRAKFGNKVLILDYSDVYCQQKTGYCGTTLSGNALYGYTDHISSYTASVIGQRINEQLEFAGKSDTKR